MAIADKLVIDDFTYDVELFPQVDAQSADDKYLHTQEDYFRVLIELRKRFDYFKSIVPFILYFLFPICNARLFHQPYLLNNFAHMLFVFYFHDE